MRAGTIPVTVVTGFLGAGKTTLVRRLLRDPSMQRVALVVNEVGVEPIDHTLLEVSSERMELVDGACICCSMRGDLHETLVKLFARRRAGEVIDFDRVVVETSGLADPAPILQTLMRDADLERAYRLDAVVTLVDAVNGPQQLDTLAEPLKQAAVADRIVVTKADLVDATRLDAITERLRAINPHAGIVAAAHGAIDPAFVAGVAPRGRRAAAAVTGWLGTGTGNAPPLRRPAATHTPGVASFSLRFDAPFERELLLAWLDVLTRLRGADLLRVKGLVHVAGEPGPVVVHAVQHVRHPPVTLDAWPDADRASRFVFVTRGIDAADLTGLLDALRTLDKGRSSRT